MRKKINKEHIIAFTTYLVIFGIIFLAITNTKYIFGSTIDFEIQHFSIPEYFRTLFYNTHDLFPDFAFNLGSGTNIFYFSYYGLLSPIIMISYLFPSISMLNYIIISSSVIVIASSFMMYLYLKKNNYSFTVSFLGGLIFLCASPIIFHAHRHIMFINYMPFLILGMFGVDKYFKIKKSPLLAISVFLMIMTSYYYSVGGIISLILLGIYKYLKQNKFKIKEFIREMLRFSMPFIIGIIMGMLIILPTLYTLLNGRGKANVDVNFLNLITPNLNFKNILYSPYAIGTTIISILSAIYLTIKGKVQDKFLGIVILLIGLFSLFNYILNGFLYIDPKSLIPLLPLVVIATCKFLKDLLNNKIDYKLVFITLSILFIADIILMIISSSTTTNYEILQSGTYLVDTLVLIIILLIYKKYKNRKVIIIYMISFLFGCALIVNLGDQLMSKDNDYTVDAESIKQVLKDDESFYRINNFYLNGSGLNKIININTYQSALYSSTFNKEYNKFYYDVFNNPIIYRNRSMTAFSPNILFNNYIGEKYIITDKNIDLGYDNYVLNKNLKIYKNEDAFSIGYATNNIINEKEYQKLTYPNNVISLLNSVITTTGNTNTKIKTIKSENINYKILNSNNIKYKKTKDGYRILSKKNGKLRLKINDNMKNKVLFIRFKNNEDPSCKKNDLAITINGVMNKLTCKSWKYHNGNFIFDYVLYNQDTLEIEFAKGLYDLSSFQFYILDYDEVKNINKEHDIFNINNDKTSGDTINGTIEVKNTGYFILQVPYDKGFKIKIDNKQTTYEKVNEAFIGFKINKGRHTINIEYEAPLKKLGIILNLFGLTLFAIYSIITLKKEW